MPFQTIGSLMLEFEGHADYSDYRRELDLEKAIASVRYKIGEVNYTRTVFTSLADNALIVRIEADNREQSILPLDIALRTKNTK